MTNKLVISSGHSLHVRGAAKLIDEVTEARRVVERVFAILGATGVAAIKYHDDVSKTQAANLKAITGFHNKQQREIDVSVHFNAASYTTAARGVEVLHYNKATQAATLSAAIATAGGLKNRGQKQRKDLAFLRDTNKPALLIEVCFVDSEADVKLYKKNFEQICQAIAKTLANFVGVTPKKTTTQQLVQKPQPVQLYRVETGTYTAKAQADAAAAKIKAAGIASVVSVVQSGSKYIVRTGTYTTQAAAQSAVDKIILKKIAWVCTIKKA